MSVETGQDSHVVEDGDHSTRGPSAEARRIICHEVAKSAANAFGERLRALILTGSVARDEATVIEKGGTKELLGDAEFILVFAEGAKLPDPGAVRHLAQDIEGRLARRGVLCSMDLDAVHPSFLRGLRPHIFAYELRSCGQVVDGDQTILQLIPSFTAADIPLEDAWRLLSNRMIEQLDAAAELTTQPGTLPRNAQYRTIKLYRDMATSFLVFVRAYEPTYRGRAERLRSLAADPSTKWDLPFPLHEFSSRVSACTDFNLQGNQVDLSDHTGNCVPTISFWQEAVAQTRLLWRWELMQLTDGQASLTDQDLLKRWMKAQPVRDRARGWAYVLRKCGWHRSWREWPRWYRLSGRGSPRYCVYAAASQLCFQLPEILGLSEEERAAQPDFNDICSWLPVDHREPETRDPGWLQAAFAISWNYKRFLTGTRS